MNDEIVNEILQTNISLCKTINIIANRYICIVNKIKDELMELEEIGGGLEEYSREMVIDMLRRFLDDKC